MNLEIASLFLILFSVIIIVWGIAVVHTLPGKIAKKTRSLAGRGN